MHIYIFSITPLTGFFSEQGHPIPGGAPGVMQQTQHQVFQWLPFTSGYVVQYSAGTWVTAISYHCPTGMGWNSLNKSISTFYKSMHELVDSQPICKINTTVWTCAICEVVSSTSDNLRENWTNQRKYWFTTIMKLNTLQIALWSRIFHPLPVGVRR